MKPEFSIAYSHTLANGLLGMGFDVSGLSSIRRCPKTIAQDGAAGRVLLDLTDVFCLDGNRLRLESGTYGVTGSVYRTELETYARIVANGSAGNGPAWFEVKLKSGLIYEYGNSTDSRIDFGSATPKEWALNAIRDRAGNRIDLKYTEDATNGSYRPGEVNRSRVLGKLCL